MLIVFDASTIVGAALRADGLPRRALLRARERHVIVLSEPVFAEIDEVLKRPKFNKVLTEEVRAEIVGLLTVAAVWVEVSVKVEDCRDIKANKYLELAAVAGASIIVSSDEDLLVLHPWRGVWIMRPRYALAELG